MFIVSKYHIDIDHIRYHKSMMDEYWILLQYVENLIYNFYNDLDGSSTRIHICQLGNMSGKIGNTHSFWHIIPRTSKSLELTINSGKLIFTDP